MSKDTGFGLEELLRQQFHIVMGLWNAKRKVHEEENEAQKEQEGKQMSGYNIPSTSSMMSSAKGMMPSGMSSYMSKMPHL